MLSEEGHRCLEGKEEHDHLTALDDGYYDYGTLMEVGQPVVVEAVERDSEEKAVEANCLPGSVLDYRKYGYDGEECDKSQSLLRNKARKGDGINKCRDY